MQQEKYTGLSSGIIDLMYFPGAEAKADYLRDIHELLRSLSIRLGDLLLAAIMYSNFRILVIFALLACRSNSNEVKVEGKTVQVVLVDSLGIIETEYPNGTDTFFSWIRRNDCGKPCEEGKYRFQSKRNRIFKESGFFWTNEPNDSISQMTITHSRNIFFLPTEDSFAVKHLYIFKSKLEEDPRTGKITNQQLKKIGDRYFAIFQVEDFDTKRQLSIRRLIAYTGIRGNLVEIRYDRLTKIEDSSFFTFHQTSLQNLLAIRVKDGG